MRLSLELAIVGKHRTELIGGYHRPARDLPASTPLQLKISWPTKLGVIAEWEDGAEGVIEHRLVTIAADIIVAGETAFRRSLVEEIERQEAARQREAEARQRKLEQLQAQRIEHLEKSSEMLVKAERIRALIAQVHCAAATGKADVSAEEQREWYIWAAAYADSLDPLISGQLFQHVRDPTK